MADPLREVKLLPVVEALELANMARDRRDAQEFKARLYDAAIALQKAIGALEVNE